MFKGNSTRYSKYQNKDIVSVMLVEEKEEPSEVDKEVLVEPINSDMKQ